MHLMNFGEPVAAGSYRSPVLKIWKVATGTNAESTRGYTRNLIIAETKANLRLGHIG